MSEAQQATVVATGSQQIEAKPTPSEEHSRRLTDDQLKQVGDWIGSEFKSLSRLKKKAGKLFEESEHAFAELKSRTENIKNIQQDIESLRVNSHDASNSCVTASEMVTQELLKASSARSSAEDACKILNQHKESVESLITNAKNAAEKCAHIDDGHKYVLDTKPRIEQMAKSADLSAKAAETACAKIDEYHNTAKESANDAQMLRQLAQSDRATVEKIVIELKAAHQELETLNSELVDRRDQSNELKRQIESLLPGATSAGLAQAFECRRKSHKWPQIVWDFLSVASLLGLVALGLLFFTSDDLKGVTTDWTRPIPYLIIRIPVAFGLIWLAIHAARRAAELRRVSEDYGYKAALAISFEG